jgi:polar amino acid transport system substrate-binding protein
MKLLTHLTSIAVAGIAFAALAVPAVADQLQDILSAGKIRVGVIQDVAPFGYLDANQKPAGLDIDVANMIAKDLGVEAELVPMTAQNRIPYLVTKKVDILVALLSLTPERAKQIMFTAPYAATSIGIFGPADAKLASVDELGSRSIGVTRGTTEDTALTATAPKANIVRFEDNATATTAYESGQVDLYATADILAYAINTGDAARKLEPKVSFGADLAFMGVRAGEFGMLQWLNSFIYVHKQNGDLGKLSKKWLNMTLPPMEPL